MAFGKEIVTSLVKIMCLSLNGVLGLSQNAWNISFLVIFLDKTFSVGQGSLFIWIR